MAGSAPHELAQRGADRRGGGVGPGKQEERPGLVRGQTAEVGAGPADELPPAAARL